MKLVNSTYRLLSRLPDNPKIRLGKIFDRIPMTVLLGPYYLYKCLALQGTQKLNAEQVEHLQFLELKKMVEKCYNKSSYYRKLYDSHNFKPDMLKTLQDIERIPMISKSMIRNEIENVSSSKCSFFNRTSHTGGTTSSSISFSESITASISERAFIYRYLNWHGISEYDSSIILKGNELDSEASWYYSPLFKASVFLFKDISDDRIINYSKIIRLINPKAIISGYPSLVYAMALAINRGVIEPFDSIKFISCSSESLHSYQKREIKKAFGVSPAEHYGQNEKVSIIQQCNYLQYHIIPEYGVTEVVDSNGSHISKDGETGEIVGTGFLNSSFPLIRYRTGDYATIKSDHRCLCGRSFKTIERIDGRSGDFLTSSDGTMFSTPLIDAAIENCSNIIDIQLVQKSFFDVDIYISVDNGFDSSDESELINDLRRRTNYKFSFTPIITDSISKPPNGKKRLIVSRINSSVYR